MQTIYCGQLSASIYSLCGRMSGPSVKLNDGHELPLIGLGTSGADGELLGNALAEALRIGYRLYDTAQVYGNQTTVGPCLLKEATKQGIPLSDIVISTKVYLTKENTRENVKHAIEKAHKELNGREGKKEEVPIGVCMIHYPTYDSLSPEAMSDPENPKIRIEGYKALLEMKEAGLIRSVGVSNYEVKHLEEIEDAKLQLPALNQVEYHPHFVRRDILEYCAQKGIFVQAFASMGGGGGTSALTSEPLLADIGANSQPKISPYGVLLAYAVTQNIGVIPKSVNPARLLTNFKEAQCKLSAEDISLLNELDKGTEGHCVKRCKGWKVQ